MFGNIKKMAMYGYSLGGIWRSCNWPSFYFILGFVNCLIAYADVNAIDYMNILEFVGKFLFGYLSSAIILSLDLVEIWI